MYAAATQWIKKWKGNGWHTTDGGAVKNKPDLQRLDDLCSRVDVKWVRSDGGESCNVEKFFSFLHRLMLMVMLGFQEMKLQILWPSWAQGSES